MTNRKLYQEIASTVDARLTCIARNNTEWIDNHTDRINDLITLLPHGSGIDGETTINMEASTGEKLLINFSFHHMDEMGGYDGWTDHTLIVTPSLQHDITLRITGTNRNNIKEYLYEIFYQALIEVVEV